MAVSAALPSAAGLSSAGFVARGGPIVDSPRSNAFVDPDVVFYADEALIPASVMHNALIENSGQSAYAATSAGARDFVRRFSLPARGINGGALHGHNAIDVAGACGSGVYAVSAGQVVVVKNGFSGGYGNYADIDHGNGVLTRYAHAESVIVTAGQMVAGGDVIARMGNTGNSTGCHVHFEVLGPSAVTNPFAKR